MMEPSFEKLLARLAEANVRFVIVGGIAVALHGYTRFTEDIDLLIDDDAANIRDLLGLLGDFGEGHAKELNVEDFADEEGAIRVIEETELCQIDLFTRLAGKSYRDVAPEAETFRLGKFTILYASKSSLLFWKKSSHREKDRLDANALHLLMENPQAFDDV